MTEKAYQSTSFNIALSLVCDEVAVMSDLVFPDNSFMEREFHSILLDRTTFRKISPVAWI